MPEVVVNHSGGVKSNSTGRVHSFEEGVPVDLPEDAIKALGDNAKSPKTVAKEEKAEKEEAEKKEVKTKQDRQVKSGETVTK